MIERPAGALWLEDIERLMKGRKKGEVILLYGVRSLHKIYNVYLDSYAELTEDALRVRDYETLGAMYNFDCIAYHLIPDPVAHRKSNWYCFIFENYWFALGYHLYCKYNGYDQ